MSPPMIAESGSGARVRDADGNEYIDYCMSWGSLILGHAHPGITDAAIAQMRRGIVIRDCDKSRSRDGREDRRFGSIGRKNTPCLFRD